MSEDEVFSFLDRIEAAHKREVEKLNSVIQATVSRSDAEIDRLRREVAELRKQIGNAAKLREAVQSILGLAYEVAAETEEPRCKISNDWLIETCKAALAEPPRQCDVGDANEQSDRFDAYCKDNDCKTKSCPADRMGFVSCSLVWANLPYNESEVSHGNA